MFKLMPVVNVVLAFHASAAFGQTLEHGELWHTPNSVPGALRSTGTGDEVEFQTVIIGGDEFEQPRVQLEGTRSGNRMVGTWALSEDEQCDDVVSFDVEGTIDKGIIHLTGTEPSVDENCQIIETVDFDIEIKYVFTPLPEHEAAETPPPSWVRDEPFKAYFLSDPLRHADELASYLPVTNAEINRDIEYAISGYGGLLLDACIYDAYELPFDAEVEDAVFYHLAGIVRQAESVKASLIALGYPRDLVVDSVHRFRSRYIEQLAKRLNERRPFGYQEIYDEVYLEATEQFVVLAKYQRDRAPQLLPPATNGPMCGGDLFGATLVVTDPEAPVWVITEFDYQYCDSLGLDPDADERCDLWMRLLPGTALPNGDYLYRVRWPDGRLEIDRLAFFDDGSAEGAAKVTITPGVL